MKEHTVICDRISRWTGYYRGILREITTWNTDPTTRENYWALYVSVYSTILSANDFEDFWLTDDNYWKVEDKWTNCSWHRGVTFYEKKENRHCNREMVKTVKIGCDYDHDGDKNMVKNEHILLKDSEIIIDELHEIYNFIKRKL